MPLPPNRVDYLPIVDRPVIKWPKKARVAFWVSPNVEHYEYQPIYDGVRNPWPRSPYPDAREYSYCDYGNRVGFWRMVKLLDKNKIKCTVSLNMAVLEHYPEVRDAMVERDWDFMSHGIYNTVYLNTYSEKEEREFYRDNIDTLKKQTGKQLKGMLGPAISGTDRTPDLMAEAGLIYHTDWMHDDQPVPIKVRKGRLVSVPYSVETNDGIISRNYADGEQFYKICKAQFDVLYREGEESGRVMCVAIHPFLTGQPHRAKYVEKAFDYIMSHDGVWQATADEIAECYLDNYYEQFVSHAARLNGEEK
ncbi:MAG: polysaccharide deacetylase [SAR202 cluster bacterium]|nr:polysaccharide deacetylase [SAR202 cluster bacterium]